MEVILAAGNAVGDELAGVLLAVRGGHVGPARHLGVLARLDDGGDVRLTPLTQRDHAVAERFGYQAPLALITAGMVFSRMLRSRKTDQFSR